MQLGSACVDAATGKIKGSVVSFTVNGRAIGQSPDGQWFIARMPLSRKPKRLVGTRCKVMVPDFTGWLPGVWETQYRVRIDKDADPVWGGALLTRTEARIRSVA